MKYILQIHTGSWRDTADRPEEIIRKIREIASRIRVEQVIIGWNTDPAVYEKTGEALHAAGIRMILWLPVFSEIDKIAEPDEALDIFGKRITTPEQVGKSFTFACPTSPNNVRIAEEIYDKYFSGCGFDGVFLDRIRSQSFVSGVPGVLSCGCGRCRKAFLQRGVDIDEVEKLYREKGDSFFDMAAWPMNGQFRLKNDMAQRFFEAKEEMVAGAVTEICSHFREKGLTVGLDLFAPAVSRFVGQRYGLITKNADFIKPMLYRRTDAPAGTGYEYTLFEKAAPGARGFCKPAMDRAFLKSQLEAAGEVSCEKYPGIELNYDAELVRTDTDYIRESLAAIRDCGFEGAVLSWNIMQVPNAHIEAVYRFEQEQD